jgi:hypothetical protein
MLDVFFYHFAAGKVKLIFPFFMMQPQGVPTGWLRPFRGMLPAVHRAGRRAFTWFPE